MLSRVERDLRKCLVLIALPGLLVAMVLGGTGLSVKKGLYVAAIAGIAILLAMHREVLRTMLLIRADARLVFHADIGYALCLLLAVSLACQHPLPAAPTAVTGFLAAAGLASIIAYRALVPELVDPARESAGTQPDAQSPWLEMRSLAIWSSWRDDLLAVRTGIQHHSRGAIGYDGRGGSGRHPPSPGSGSGPRHGLVRGVDPHRLPMAA